MTRLIPVVAFSLLLSSVPAAAVDLKISDSRGTQVLLTSASIDYGGFMAADKETQGIRVLLGDGLVTARWSDIGMVKIVRKDDSVRPPRIEIEITLKNGKKVAAALYRQGQMKLLGKTELGDYSIDLERVRTIEPVR